MTRSARAALSARATRAVRTAPAAGAARADSDGGGASGGAGVGDAAVSAVRYVATILWITLQRVAKNWRLLAALLAGLLLVSALAATIPIYTAAALQRSFAQQWRAQDNLRPPFAIIIAHRNSRRQQAVPPEQLRRLASEVGGALRGAVGHDAIGTSFAGSFGTGTTLLDGTAAGRQATARLGYMSNLAGHAVARLGRMHQPRSDGVVEVVADGRTLDDLELQVGRSYLWAYEMLPDEQVSGLDVERRGDRRFALVPIEVVGVFDPMPGVTAREWIFPPLPERLFVDPAEFERLQEAGLRAATLDLQWVFEDRLVRVDRLGSLIAELQAVEERAAALAPDTRYWHSPLEFFQAFKPTLDQVSLFLFALAAPTLGMLLIYVVMISALAVQRRVDEIAVLHSRGAGRVQLIVSFGLEWLLLALVAGSLGPLLGLPIGQLVGGAQGFMEFGVDAGRGVAPAPLPVSVTGQSQRLALLATGVAVVAAVVPVAVNSGFSIVALRQLQARGLRRSAWHRYYVDVALLALAFYGYSGLRWQSARLAVDATVDADPLLFLVPVAFFVGGGLLALRLYPLAMARLSWLANRFRGVVLQLTLRRLSRDAGQYISLLVLLVLTVAMGVYNGSAARTLRLNLEDRVRYQVGADLVVRESWTPPGGEAGGGPGGPGDEGFPRPGRPRPRAAAEPRFWRGWSFPAWYQQLGSCCAGPTSRRTRGRWAAPR